MNDQKKLTIRWQRLLMDGETCPRCGTTETEVEKAVAALTPALASLGIAVVLEKRALSVEAFKQDTLQSNTIWLNDRLLEDWLEAKTGQSECCEVCGPNDCRTVSIGDEVYESIPAELIVKAGLFAAAELVDRQSCSCYPPAIWPAGGCCIE